MSVRGTGRGPTPPGGPAGTAVAPPTAGESGPMRLYRYVDTKEELLDLMADAVYGEIRAPKRTAGDWRAGVRSLARGTRGAALRHEWFADLLGGRPHLGPSALGHNGSPTQPDDPVSGRNGALAVGRQVPDN